MFRQCLWNTLNVISNITFYNFTIGSKSKKKKKKEKEKGGERKKKGFVKGVCDI